MPATPQAKRKSRTIAVVGGGAAGFFAAIACARKAPGARVMIFEAAAHPLAKVRISGGGRCNVTHACFDPRELASHYPRGSRELLGPFHRWQPRDTVDWFAAEGVELKTEADGRMFPVTDRSATVVDGLLEAARRAGVELRTRCGVNSVTRAGPHFELSLAGGESCSCERILIASGGGSSSAGFRIAASLGHTIEPLVPSLFTLHIDDPRLKGLAGVSVGDVEVSVAGSRASQTGPLLITHWGLSGPAILKLSAWSAREMAAANHRFKLRVNFVGDRPPAKVSAELERMRTDHPKRQLGSGGPLPMPIRLWERLIAAAGAEPARKWSGISNDALGRLADQITAAEFDVSGKSMNKEEFVTCGGVRLSEVDFRTMESRLCPGLFFAGEVLDIDAVTGGFNFQAAWTTGWLAGNALAEGFLPMTDGQ